MAVHTLGSTSTPTYGYNVTQQYNEVGPNDQVTAPSGGMYVSSLFAYFGNNSGGAMTVELVLFDGLYHAATRSGQYTVNGEAWQSQTITPYFIGAGSTCGVGWFVAQNTYNVKFHVKSSGNWRGLDIATLSSIASAPKPGSPFVQGALGWYIEYLDPLLVYSVSPSTSATGVSVTLSGVGFTGGSITGITFNGTAASTWTVNSDTSLTVTVPAGATTGPLVVSSDHGNNSVTWTLSSGAAPTITSFTPTTGAPGTSVTITGTGFTGATAVKFNGTPASTFTVNSSTSITASPASGTTTGTISVTTANGTGTSSGSFTVTAPTGVSCSIYNTSFQTSAALDVYDGAAWQAVSSISSWDGVSAWQATS